VYNLTDFLDSHPGGVGPILAKAGRIFPLLLFPSF
jgi:hypothetical protein